MRANFDNFSEFFAHVCDIDDFQSHRLLVKRENVADVLAIIRPNRFRFLHRCDLHVWDLSPTQQVIVSPTRKRD